MLVCHAPAHVMHGSRVGVASSRSSPAVIQLPHLTMVRTFHPTDSLHHLCDPLRNIHCRMRRDETDQHEDWCS
jgi:hypothetical protein